MYHVKIKTVLDTNKHKEDIFTFDDLFDALAFADSAIHIQKVREITTYQDGGYFYPVKQLFLLDIINAKKAKL